MVEAERKPEPSRSAGRVRGVFLLLLVIVSYGSALMLAGMALKAEWSVVLLPLAPFLLWGLWVGVRDAWFRQGRWLKSALAAFVLVVMVAVGLLVNQFMLDHTCTDYGCGSSEPYGALAVPEVYGLLILHVLVVVAYAVSRRRPEALRPRGEALVSGTLACGIVLHVVLGLQFFNMLPEAWLLPFTFPVLTPYITVIVLGSELVRRLRRRGLERVQNPEKLHPAIGMAAAFHVVLGAWAILDALLFGHVDAAWRTFSATCSHTFSTLEVVRVQSNCHYLCTIAARGHVWLVRPERIGSRHGVPIVVNRQLAVANAFEDLLIARCPRIARVCRKVYDRYGLPLSRWLRHPLASDLVYVAMKPAEWVFYLVLLLCDRTNPEARIARMYPALGAEAPDR